MSPQLSAREMGEVERANASGRPTVVFVHGLWVLSSSWDPWRTLFEEVGYATVAPDWPDDPETAEIARAEPARLAGNGITRVVDHLTDVLGTLEAPPTIIGHSFGGLITQILAGRGLASVSVPIDPAPGRGVLPLPLSASKAAAPVLRNPANRNRAVMLSYEQFVYAFANAVEETEARQLYERFAVPGPGRPLFEAATANLNPRTAAYADPHHPRRGPMKFIAGEKDHTVPRAIVRASFGRQRNNPAVTEFEEIADRGHSLVFDSGWRTVAHATLAFIENHRPH